MSRALPVFSSLIFPLSLDLIGQPNDIATTCSVYTSVATQIVLGGLYDQIRSGAVVHNPAGSAFLTSVTTIGATVFTLLAYIPWHSQVSLSCLVKEAPISTNLFLGPTERSAYTSLSLSRGSSCCDNIALFNEPLYEDFGVILHRSFDPSSHHGLCGTWQASSCIGRRRFGLPICRCVLYSFSHNSLLLTNDQSYIEERIPPVVHLRKLSSEPFGAI